jgi:membrane associated rhomboid family serine protease
MNGMVGGTGNTRGQIQQTSRNVWFAVRQSALVAIGILAVIWVIQGINAADGYRLDGEYGLVARSPSSLWHIFTMPFLHVSMEHIESNSMPLLILSFVAALGGLRYFWMATGFIIVVDGLGTWLISPSNVVTVGASGLIFGYLGFVVARGLFTRKIWQAAIGALMAVYYFWTLPLLFPDSVTSSNNISWQGHLCGLIAGVAAALLVGRHSREVARPAVAGPYPPLGSGPFPPPGF